MITFQEFPKEGAIEAALEMNTNWTLGAPARPGNDYLKDVEAFKVQKLIILRKIKKDLALLLEEGGSTFATYVWHIVERELAVAFWQAKCGVFPIWNSIFSKACGRTRKALKGDTDLNSLSKGMFNHGSNEASKAGRTSSVSEQRLRGKSPATGFGG